ncbi:hypothetical protein [Methanobacterium sp.]|uniref:hypothetical protein n=1 Tax=Methanobacterium sp. TaxID=2164 RepID=UPI00315893A8
MSNFENQVLNKIYGRTEELTNIKPKDIEWKGFEYNCIYGVITSGRNMSFSNWDKPSLSKAPDDIIFLESNGDDPICIMDYKGLLFQHYKYKPSEVGIILTNI